jgi:radical SAM superfamily enzyme YgiQ (UPF0313 family)
MINKICLIIPPSPFLLDERVFMHIGILKVASVLEKNNFKVDVLDLAGVEEFELVVKQYVEKNNTLCYGITATTPQVPYAFRISKVLRAIIPEARIILGGTHVSLMHSAYKKEVAKNIEGRATKDLNELSSNFDVLVAGDGEKSIFEAINSSNKIIDADNVKSSYFLSNQEFSELPLPARHLVDVSSYKYTIDGVNSVSLIAQLGCPFKCTFCGGRNSPFLRKIRTRDTASVLYELEHLYNNYGFTGFMFYDDELNVNKQWETLLEEIINLQKKLNTSFKLRGFVKSELFTQRQADLMYKAGFRWLLTGFESGDERILSNIEKNATVEDNTKCIHFAKNAGLKVKALMSLGHAGESKESIDNTKNWLLETKPEEFDCTIITTYPGSPYFDDAVKTGSFYSYEHPKSKDKLYQDDVNYLLEPDYYKGDPNGGYTSHVWTDHLDKKELVVLRDELESTVRKELNIKFNQHGTVIKFEHSMGQGLPTSILKSNHEDIVR